MRKTIALGVALCFGAACAEVRPQDTWEWHDGSVLPQEGRGFSDPATPYVRIPDRLRRSCSGAVWGLSRNSSGICYRFSTDSRQMRVKWTVGDPVLSTHNMTGAGRSGVDVYGWDEGTKTWRFVKGSRPKQTDNELSFPWTPGRPCMIYLPLYNEVVRFEVGVLKGAKVAPLPPRASGVSCGFGNSWRRRAGCSSRATA